MANKLAANSVWAGAIQAGAVTAVKIQAGVVPDNFNDLAGQIGSADIAAGAVIAGKLASNSIFASNIRAGAVTVTKIQAGVVPDNFSDLEGQVGSADIAAGAIVTGKIAANAVGASEIRANSVAASEIVAGSITATEILNSAGLIRSQRISETIEYKGGASILDWDYEVTRLVSVSIVNPTITFNVRKVRLKNPDSSSVTSWYDEIRFVNWPDQLSDIYKTVREGSSIGVVDRAQIKVQYTQFSQTVSSDGSIRGTATASFSSWVDTGRS